MTEIGHVKSNLRTPSYLLHRALLEEYSELFAIMEALTKSSCSMDELQPIATYYNEVVTPGITGAEHEVTHETAAKIKNLRKKKLNLDNPCFQSYDLTKFKAIQLTIDGILKTMLRTGGRRKTARKRRGRSKTQFMAL